MKGKQESVDSRLSTMKQENEALWREVAALRQKHMKPEYCRPAADPSTSSKRSYQSFLSLLDSILSLFSHLKAEYRQCSFRLPGCSWFMRLIESGCERYCQRRKTTKYCKPRRMCLNALPILIHEDGLKKSGGCEADLEKNHVTNLPSTSSTAMFLLHLLFIIKGDGVILNSPTSGSLKAPMLSKANLEQYHYVCTPLECYVQSQLRNESSAEWRRERRPLRIRHIIRCPTRDRCLMVVRSRLQRFYEKSTTSITKVIKIYSYNLIFSLIVLYLQ